MQALRESRGEIVEPSLYPPWREMLEVCETHRHHLSEKDLDLLESAVLWRRLNPFAKPPAVLGRLKAVERILE